MTVQLKAEPRLILLPAFRQAWPVAVGLGALVGLLILYLGIVGLTSRSLSHALELMGEDRYFIAAVSAGFGLQMGLYTYLRRQLRTRQAAQPATALAAAGTGTSTLSMVACCAHHVADVMPLVGLSGAAIFLAEYKVPFMALGLAMNGTGIAVALRAIRKAHSGMECHQETAKGEGVMAKDPVCGMDVQESKAAATSEYKGKKYYFCAVGCKKAFDKDPEKYLKG